MYRLINRCHWRVDPADQLLSLEGWPGVAVLTCRCSLHHVTTTFDWWHEHACTHARTDKLHKENAPGDNSTLTNINPSLFHAVTCWLEYSLSGGVNYLRFRCLTFDFSNGVCMSGHCVNTGLRANVPNLRAGKNILTSHTWMHIQLF